MRGRHKRRGYHESGFKLDSHTYSSDMCPHCISIGCDPFAMSPKFRHKVEERRRKGLCHCCGKPLEHCSCRSSKNVAAGTHTIQTHNNRKLRKAQALVQTKEDAYRAWSKAEDALRAALGDALYEDVSHQLYRHKPQNISYDELCKRLRGSDIDIEQFRAGWNF